jgi:hypothetical protein
MVFLFTDNSTAEPVYWKGNSSSETLFDLMHHLRKLKMKGDLILHMIHVARTQMQEEGADGSSQGDHTTGVMSGTLMLQYILLHTSAPELEPKLLEWFGSCWDFKINWLEPLTPVGWFSMGMQPRGNFLWTLAPAAADVAGEQMAWAIILPCSICMLPPY